MTTDRKTDNPGSSGRPAMESGVSSGSRWIDVSVPLRNGMVHWPGDSPFAIERIHSIEGGASNNLSTITMGAHNGTHMDAPLHFIANGIGIDKIPLVTIIGRARVIEIQDPESIKVKELKEHKIRGAERILFKTRNSRNVWWTDFFVEDFVFISKEAARFLARRNVALVGVDYLSVGGFKRDGADVHRTLLKAGIWIIEGLDLSQVAPGRYDLVCLPLKLTDGDGAPARVVLKPIRAGER